MAPIVDGGQSGFFAHGFKYSDGASYVYDAASNETGRGFSESVNYVDGTNQARRITGCPGIEEMVSLLQASAPSNQLRSGSLNYVMMHQEELNQAIADCIGI